VAAVGKRTKVPSKIMGILSGESIINDASGIVCFQFAVVCVITGSFSIAGAAWRFALVGLGGILAGMLMTLVKYSIVKWLRSLGIENVALHLLIGILTPFIIYMASESLGVSGILAVFTSGIAHSLARDKLNPDTVSLNIALDSVWSLLSFTFEGIVFVMLGTQLPGILKTIGGHSLDWWGVSGCVFALALIFAAMRFIWWALMVRKKAYQEQGKPIGKIKSGIIFSLAGARGTVTLVSVMSIPLLLPSGAPFPERNLIILLASGVIVVSMLVTNFVLPLFVERKTEQRKNETELSACSEIIQKVATRLLLEATEENRSATTIVARGYFERNPAAIGKGIQETAEDKKLQAQALLWERENIIALLGKGEIGSDEAGHFLEVLEARIRSVGGDKRMMHEIAWIIKHLIRFKHLMGRNGKRNDFRELLGRNSLYVLEKLKAIKNPDNARAVEKLASSYEMVAAFHKGLKMGGTDAAKGEGEESLVYEVATKGFHIERGLIQEMFETGRLSWETAKEMRTNIAALEARMQAN
jgi:CPA1 family monovalent cation:H+ antiporter